MSGYYKDRVKVIGANLMCFPARPGDLEPLACSTYDPYALADPDPEPIETISVAEWNERRGQMYEQRAHRTI
jgi:hypothetical protein